MAGLRPWSASLLLALLFLLALPLEGGREALDSEAPTAFAASAASSLPLIQMLLSQAPPRSWLPGRSRRRANGQPLRYMRNLYRSVADRHGRPRRDGRLSSNAIRLVRPSAKARQAEAGELGPGLPPGLPELGLSACSTLLTCQRAWQPAGPGLGQRASCCLSALSGAGNWPEEPQPAAPLDGVERLPRQQGSC